MIAYLLANKAFKKKEFQGIKHGWSSVAKYSHRERIYKNRI